MRRLLTIVLGLVMAAAITNTAAADYPSRPIIFMTMTQPGAQIDRLTRGLAQRFSKILGEPINVKNVTGAHGTVMAATLARAKPDGYTLGITSLTAYTYAPHHDKLPYTPEDFDYLSLVALNSSGFISKADAPWNTLKEAFEWAKKNNNGTLIAMFHGADDRDAILRMAKQEGVKLSLIPSKGGPSVIKAVTGGHAQVGYVGAILYKFVEAGQIKLIGSALSIRLPPIPDVPTLQEQGYNEKVEMIVALVAPKGLPADVKAKLLAAADQLANDKETQKFITEGLLMRPVQWGEAHADQTQKELYATFGEHAKAK
ncbi:MAG: tripartite tricarboxylate transporter substrate binding protein [Proteobacteria bacterium]|jgi:putative tricarboxylic transport membrane protein|nr:tripartite tricarboxylate transporter substrate binding protein [Pseudomonadota bacterium]MCG6935311.1 tripartite tricarboxylate transporter substrate binding protein [Pseudomonadota bacterium]